MELIGRQAELDAIDALVAGARSGHGSALVLEGEAGIGKTSLLRHAMQRAAGMDRIGIAGVQIEASFAYAALQRVLSARLDRLDDLPTAQRQALSVALGMAKTAPADPVLVGLAALTLLADSAETTPILLSIDDAQWLDAESALTLAFIGRRLQAEGMGLLLTLRGPTSDMVALDGLPRRLIGGLDEISAIALLRSRLDRPIDLRLAQRVVEQTGGHPLALIDLGPEIADGHLAARTLRPLPVTPRLEAHYLRQVADLPAATQEWLLVAAAEPHGDVWTVSSAAAALGLVDTAAAPAESAHVVSIHDHVIFRHPLLRSAIYGGATAADRRRVHLALAEVPARAGYDGRAVCHRAAAAVGPDREVADELVRCAEDAGRRGGFAARAEFLAKAAELSPDLEVSTARLVEAAESAHIGGSPMLCRTLLDRIDETVLDEAQRSRVQVLRAMIGVTDGQPDATATAPATALEAAAAMPAEQPEAIRAALLRTLDLAIVAEGLMRDTTLQAVAEAIRRRPPVPARSPADDLLDAFAVLVDDGYEAAAPRLRQAVAALLGLPADAPEVLTHHQMAVTYAMMTWDDEAHLAVLDRADARARATGALRDLDTVMFERSMAETLLGRLAAADRLLAEGHQIRAAVGATADQWEIYRPPELTAWRGGGEEVLARCSGTAEAGVALGIGAMVSIAHIGEVIHHLGHGDYGAACTIAQQLVDGDQLGVHSRVLPDLVEAAIRSGQRPLAERSLSLLTARAQACGTNRAAGITARSAALLSYGEAAEPQYAEAIELLTGDPGRSDLARAHLLYGEWLRRRRRRRDARAQLRAALTCFETMGATTFADRARRELEAAGANTAPSPAGFAVDLTTQEATVARMAAGGATNPEIAAHLYLSRHTVDYHLRKVYRKLGVSSRQALHAALPD